jgi:predicted nucleic acid-binding protein
MAALELLAGLVRILEPETHIEFEVVARARIGRRDEDDWPVVASALALGCPIWTEDTDFFGCGVPTWTSDRVELDLANHPQREG